MHVLVTGASGFVGTRLCDRLVGDGALVKPVYRYGFQTPCPSSFIVSGIDSRTDWTKVFEGIDVVVHLAARVHVMNDSSEDPLAAFREVNTYGTLNLAKQAAEAGVKRFIFLSSIKVNGESTSDKPFVSSDFTVPLDPYGISKCEAEQGLLKVAQETRLEIVIIRPPLVYGPGVKANFLSLMRWAYRGAPLPLGAIKNKRSFIALDNLVDLICVCIDHPNAKNQIFLASDGDDLSTTELLQGMSKALGRPSRLIPAPVALLNMGARLLGRADVAQRLCGSLQVDITKTKELLNWTPPLTVEQGLKKVADAYINEGEKFVVTMKRIFDFSLALLASVALSLPIILVALAVKLTSKGPALYWSDRVGINNSIFKMPKFRSMKVDTPAVATHLLKDPKSVLTPVGDFIRKTSLDELPQLWCILKGDMSFVGPRPALFNQDDLIALRTEKQIHQMLPGLTGWAQVNGRDELPIPQKVDLDLEYLERQSFAFDIWIIWLTFLKVIRSQGVSH